MRGSGNATADAGIVHGKPLHDSHEWVKLDEALPPVTYCHRCGVNQTHPDAREPCPFDASV